MKKNFSNLILAAIFSTGIVSCGTEPEPTTAPVIQPAQQQVVKPQQSTQTATKKTTQTINAKVTTATKTASTTSTATAKTTAATETKTDTKTAATTATTTTELSAAQKILTKSKQTYDALTNFSATITNFSKRYDKLLPDAKPLTTAETKYVFQQPRNSLFNVIKHSNSMVVGAKMVWKGGDTAKAKAGGVLSLIQMELPLTDDKMTTNRNLRFDQMDHVGILSRGLDSKAEVSLAGKSNIEGKDVYMIKIKGIGTDPEITEENIAIDIKTFYIVADEMYAGKDLVYQTKINVETINSQLPSNTFDI